MDKNFCISTTAMDLMVFPERKAGFKMLFLLWIKTLNKEKLVELRNFIYYKISTIIKTLLANMTPRAFLPHPEIFQDDG